jgi:putative aldouronate transport system substrate-binding protein
MSIRTKVLVNSSAITLCAALTLTACGDSAEKGAVPNAGTNNGKTDVKYTFSIAANQVAPVDKDGDIIKYLNEKYNVDLKVVDVESSKFNEIMNLKFAAGEIPDYFKVSGYNNLNKYVSQDLLAAIPLDMLKQNAPNLYRLMEEARPGLLKLTTLDGKIYALPRMSFFNSYRRATVFRGDWMKKVGVAKSPETLKEFEELMYKYRNDDPDGNGKKDTYGLSADGIDVVYGAYGYIPDYWSDKNGKLVYGAIQPEMKEALATLNKWFKDQVIDPEFITGENQGGNSNVSSSFVAGRIGFTTRSTLVYWKPLLYKGDTSSDNYVELKKLNPQAADSLVYGVPPIGPNGKRGVRQGNLVTTEMASFGKQLEKEPAKFAKLLQMLDGMNSSYDNFLSYFYGVKGKHWDFNEMNMPVLLNNATTADMNKWGGHDVIAVNELPQYQRERSMVRVQWADSNNWKVGGIQNKLETSLPSAGKYSTELNKMQEEAYISIITGNKPLSYFDEFVEKWKKAGGDQLDKEANEWYSKTK